MRDEVGKTSEILGHFAKSKMQGSLRDAGVLFIGATTVAASYGISGRASDFLFWFGGIICGVEFSLLVLRSVIGLCNGDER